MARSASDLLQVALDNLDPAFHDLRPLLAGLAAVLASVEDTLEDAAAALLPSTSDGVWLQLIARGQGLKLVDGETDAALRVRIKARVLRVIVEAFETGVAAICDPLGADWAIVEHHRARLYCDDGATEYVTDFFCDEDHILGVHRGISIVVDAGLTDATLQSLADLGNYVRAAGIRVWLVEESSFEPITGTAWGEP